MKIAIVKLSALGDIVHALVVLQFIKKYKQEIEVDWIVEEGYKDLLESHPDINKVVVININKAKKNKSLYLFLKELRKVRKIGPYDMVIDMQGLIKSAFISRFIPSKITLGFDNNSVRERFASIFYNKTFKFAYDKNVIERNFEIIKFALDMPFKFEDVRFKLPFLFARKKYINSDLSNIKKNIILIPGASFPSKRYSVENFAKLINLLDVNYIIIWGNDDEKLLADNLKNIAPQVNICEKLSIEALISLVSQASLVIGPDTGPTHMGWALNIPSITLFGSTPGYRNSFITDINKKVESKSEVNPFRINKNDYSINDISIEDVEKIAKTLLY